MIDGVKITSLKIISDNRGSVMHMMRKDSPVYKSFGEIYFSTIFKDSVKKVGIFIKTPHLIMYVLKER